MPEIVAILSTVLTTAKKLREVADKVKDAEVKNLIADLNLNLADLKMKVAELQEENLELRGKLKEKESRSDLRSKLVLQGDLYYLQDDSSDRHPGPYCPTCFDSEGKLITVAKLASVFNSIGSYRCSKCDAVYGGK